MKSPFAPFGPVAEKGEHDSSYINELPSDIITASRAKNLPWITGFVDSDGLAVASGKTTVTPKTIVFSLKNHPPLRLHRQSSRA